MSQSPQNAVVHACERCRPICFIAPPDLLSRIANEGQAEDRAAAINALGASASIRGRRDLVRHVMHHMNLGLGDLALAPPNGERRTVYDAKHGGQSQLPGTRVRGDGDQPVADEAVNQAYDGSDTTYRFYKEILGRDSLDGHGLEMVSSVHYGNAYDNALWNGSQMVYGDGSGRILAVGSLTRSIDVIGHELTHGVTQFTAGLRYHDQSGARNESISDVFGSLVKQYSLQQTADQADWLIGAGILGSALTGEALRSMKAPGTANNFDQQPAKMSDYVHLPADNNPSNDNGGVHINSGIPNRAFFLAATAIGGHAWEKAGKVWFRALTERLKPDSDFRAAADATVALAAEMFSAGGAEHNAIQAAWHQVGVL